LPFCPQLFDRVQKTLFAGGRCLGEAGGPRRAKPRQHSARVLVVAERVQRVVVAERLAPVRHRKVGLRFLRELKLLDGLLPAETVQNRDPAQEVALGVG